MNTLNSAIMNHSPMLCMFEIPDFENGWDIGWRIIVGYEEGPHLDQLLKYFQASPFEDGPMLAALPKFELVMATRGGSERKDVSDEVVQPMIDTINHFIDEAYFTPSQVRMTLQIRAYLLGLLMHLGGISGIDAMSRIRDLLDQCASDEEREEISTIFHGKAEF